MDIPGTGGLYQITEDGVVSRNGEALARSDDGDYLYVRLSLGSRASVRKRYVHELILTTFVGERPFPEAQGRHLNGKNRENRLDNLKWGTAAENAADRVAHGTHHNIVKTHCPAGHPYSGTNLIQRKTGNRGCRACQSKANREYRERQKL